MKKIIGVYGLSGSGKTTFVKSLSKYPVKVIDADIIAREVLSKESPLLLKVAEAFGEDILLDDGSLNRKKLGEKVFTTPASLELLNSITWPEIDRIIKERALSAKEDIVIIDCPMIHRVSSKDILDELILIKSDPDILSDRLVARESITKELAKSRIERQLETEFDGYTRIIENNADINELIKKADNFFNELKGSLI